MHCRGQATAHPAPAGVYVVYPLISTQAIQNSLLLQSLNTRIKINLPGSLQWSREISSKGPGISLLLKPAWQMGSFTGLG